MNIIINRVDNIVVGVGSPTPLHILVEVSDDFELSKSVQEIDQVNQQIQKKDEQGNPLYLDGETETTESRKVTAYETKEITNTYVDADGNEITETVTAEEPSEWVDLEPIMVDNYITKFYSFSDKPELFTLEEIMNEKYSKVLETSQRDYILADMFIDENDLDLTDPQHSANTGVAICQLLPNGQAKTKPIDLEVPAKVFELLEFKSDEGVEIYVNDMLLNSVATLTSPVEQVVLKFVNTTDKPKMAKSYAIGY